MSHKVTLCDDDAGKKERERVTSHQCSPDPPEEDNTGLITSSSGGSGEHVCEVTLLFFTWIIIAKSHFMGHYYIDIFFNLYCFLCELVENWEKKVSWTLDDILIPMIFFHCELAWDSSFLIYLHWYIFFSCNLDVLVHGIILTFVGLLVLHFIYI